MRAFTVRTASASFDLEADYFDLNGDVLLFCRNGLAFAAFPIQTVLSLIERAKGVEMYPVDQFSATFG